MTKKNRIAIYSFLVLFLISISFTIFFTLNKAGRVFASDVFDYGVNVKSVAADIDDGDRGLRLYAYESGAVAQFKGVQTGVFQSEIKIATFDGRKDLKKYSLVFKDVESEKSFAVQVSAYTDYNDVAVIYNGVKGGIVYYEGNNKICGVTAGYNEQGLYTRFSAATCSLTFDSASTHVKTAATELVSFIKEATGAVLEVVSDIDTFSEDTKAISLGKTAFFAGSGLKLTDKLGETGYILKRKGNALLINSKDDNGVIFGVYDMLGHSLGLEFYSYDEYTLNKTSDMFLLDFDIEFVPSTDIRGIMMRSLNTKYRQRMRLYTGNGLGHWITFAHTVTGASSAHSSGNDLYGFLPYSVYGKAHEDWYDSSHTQVCYSNAEMRAEMVEQIKLRVAKNPDGKYLMIGHEDNFNMCECDNCKAERELYGGYGGQELNFTNLVSAEVDAWLADNYPGREIFYVFFAYQTSQEPPVKKEIVNGLETPIKDENGKCIPKYENLKIRKNVMVMYCPIDSDFSLGFSETENPTQYAQLRGWSDIFSKQGLHNNIIVWGYSLAVYNYFIPLYNFGTYNSHYKFYEDCGVHYIYDQAYSSSGVPCFEAMQIYIQSKIMYDTSLNYNDLAYDFIDHYYGAAAETFKEYFDFFRSYYEYLASTKNITGSIWQEMGKEEYWPTEVVEKLMGYLDKCLSDIEGLRTVDYERWQVLNDRLRRERLTPIYLMFTLHMRELPKDKQLEYLADMRYYTKKYEILESRESAHDIDVLIDTWANQIGG